jgi:hypothetical protein
MSENQDLEPSAPDLKVDPSEGSLNKVDPSEGGSASFVDPSEGGSASFVDPSEGGRADASADSQLEGGENPQARGGINPVQHSE